MLSLSTPHSHHLQWQFIHINELSPIDHLPSLPHTVISLPPPPPHHITPSLPHHTLDGHSVHSTPLSIMAISQAEAQVFFLLFSLQTFIKPQINPSQFVC